MMNELDEFEYINKLYEVYKNGLTDKQIYIMDRYYIYNLSLSEISKEIKISRNAVSDAIKHAKLKLIDFEEKFHLLAKIENLVKMVEKSSLTDKEKKELIEALYYGI